MFARFESSIAILVTHVALAGTPASGQEEAGLPDSLAASLAYALDDGGLAAALAFEKRASEVARESGRDPLAQVTAIERFVAARRKERLERLWGTSRVVEDRVEHVEKGETIVFGYAYRLPRDYDHEESWPVVLCLPDSGQYGEEYLDDNWTDDAAMRELADGFILVAPDAVAKTPRRRIGRRDWSREVPLERLGRHHALSLILPLMRVLETAAGDIDRVYIEGRGRGAELALELAALYGVELFSAVSVPPTELADPRIEGGLDGVPVHGIAPGTDDEGVLLARRVAFYRDHERVAVPERIHLATNNPIFRMRAWLKVTSHSIGDDVVAEAVAHLDRERNRVVVETSGIHGFTIFLSDAILDLDRPVEVFVDGELVVTEQPRRSGTYLVRQLSMLRPGETERIYTTCLPVEVPVDLQDGAPGTDEASD